jgi:hypothetical protein
MDIKMKASFTEEQYRYFAEKKGWREVEGGESYLDFAKRLALENMREFISLPLRMDMQAQLDAQTQAAIENKASEIKAGITLEE